jgi:hypothetical protein
MNLRSRSSLFALVALSLAAAACDPEHPCERGYHADHGACYLDDAGIGPGDASSDEDAAAGGGGGEATGFGKACTTMADCGGDAPLCGGAMLPFCTAVDCMADGKDLCPSGWRCLDVSQFSPDPNIKTVCVNF